MCVRHRSDGEPCLRRQASDDREVKQPFELLSLNREVTFAKSIYRTLPRIHHI